MCNFSLYLRSISPRIPPVKSADDRLCPTVRAFWFNVTLNQFPKKPNHMWQLRKHKISYLVRGVIRDSVRLIHPDMLELAAINSLDISVLYHFKKFTASYSQQHFRNFWVDLADWVGSKTHATLNSGCIRNVPHVNSTFQVPLCIILPSSELCNQLGSS